MSAMCPVVVIVVVVVQMLLLPADCLRILISYGAAESYAKGGKVGSPFDGGQDSQLASLWILPSDDHITITSTCGCLSLGCALLACRFSGSDKSWGVIIVFIYVF